LRPSIKLERVGTHHNALDDAKSQALHLMKILEALK
jgi:inhibitor of KinA sporulation pathway (predicted exonuclease)